MQCLKRAQQLSNAGTKQTTAFRVRPASFRISSSCRQHAGPRCLAIAPASKDGAKLAVLQPAAASFAAAACAAALLAAPLPAMADLVQTVPVSQVTEMAKPLPKQTIDKGRVWTAFIGGAVTVFGLTVLSENNESWFPAIFRANKAMAISRKRAQEEVQAEAAVDVEAAEVVRQQALVEEGLAEARKKMRQEEAERQRQLAQAAASTSAAAAAAPAPSGSGEGAVVNGSRQQEHRQQQGDKEPAAAAVGGMLEAQAALRGYKEQQAQAQQK